MRLFGVVEEINALEPEIRAFRRSMRERTASQGSDQDAVKAHATKIIENNEQKFWNEIAQAFAIVREAMCAYGIAALMCDDGVSFCTRERLRDAKAR